MAYLASFEQVYGVFQCPWSYSTEEFVIPYLLGRLMWNPNITDAEYWDMIEEYYEIMLGRESAGYVMEHIRGVEDNALDCCWTAMAWKDECERFEKFCRERSGVRIPFDEVRRLFPEYTEEAICESFAELYRRVMK